MNALKKFWYSLLDLFGFKRDTRYVKGYLNDANMRSGIFMSVAIAILEVFLIVRQHIKYIIPSLAKDPSK